MCSRVGPTLGARVTNRLDACVLGLGRDTHPTSALLLCFCVSAVAAGRAGEARAPHQATGEGSRANEAERGPGSRGRDGPPLESMLARGRHRVPPHIQEVTKHECPSGGWGSGPFSLSPDIRWGLLAACRSVRREGDSAQAAGAHGLHTLAPSPDGRVVGREPVIRLLPGLELVSQTGTPRARFHVQCL